MEKFEQLPEEKKQRIINAALEVFAKYEYKNASTDLIAAKSGISKGLLFYYFKNKKSLYLYLLDYITKSTENILVDKTFYSITDFYELMLYAAKGKTELIIRNPYLMDFSVRAFYAAHRDISDAVTKRLSDKSNNMLQNYFKNIRIDKFKDDVKPQEVIDMLIWMTDGYMHQKQVQEENIDMEELMKVYEKWIDMFRKISYKEEYL